MQAETEKHAIAASQTLEESLVRHDLPGQTTQHLSGDAALLYPHILRIVHRLTSKVGLDGSATDRMDASIILEKYVAANATGLVGVDIVGSLASDLDLAEGRDEAEALLGLSRFRSRRETLGQVSWRSFVTIYPALRAAGFDELSALNEVLEV